MIKRTQRWVAFGASLTIFTISLFYGYRRWPRQLNPDLIALRITEKLAENERAKAQSHHTRQIKRMGSITFIALVVALVGYLLLSQRRAIDATIRTGLPPAGSPLRFFGLPNRNPEILEAQLNALTLEGVASQANKGTLELSLPVNPSACYDLTAQLGGRCGRFHAPPRLTESPMIIEWGQVAILAIAADRPSSTILNPPSAGVPRTPLSKWTVNLVGSDTTLHIDCLTSTDFVITRAGTSPLSARCVESHFAAWRLPVRFNGGLASSRIDLHDLASLSFNVKATTAQLGVDSAQIRLGGPYTEPRESGGGPIQISSVNPHSIDVALHGIHRRVQLALRTKSARSLTVAGHSRIPTMFERNKEVWLALIIAAIVGLLTAWIDRLFLLR